MLFYLFLGIKFITCSDAVHNGVCNMDLCLVMFVSRLSLERMRIGKKNFYSQNWKDILRAIIERQYYFIEDIYDQLDILWWNFGNLGNRLKEKSAPHFPVLHKWGCYRLRPILYHISVTNRATFTEWFLVAVLTDFKHVCL